MSSLRPLPDVLELSTSAARSVVLGADATTLGVSGAVSTYRSGVAIRGGGCSGHSALSS